MRSLILAAAVIMAHAVSPVAAQTPPAPSAPTSQPPAAMPMPAPAITPQAESGKRIACRQGVTAKGLRGQDARDQMTLCMAEGQVDCVKQVIAQKIVGPQRKEFMKTCMGRKVGGERS